MLTQREKEWLEYRQRLVSQSTGDTSYYCRWCKYADWYEDYFCCLYETQDEFGECLTEPYYLNRIFDAAEFEARVAAWLAKRLALGSPHVYPCYHGPASNSDCMRDLSAITGPFAVHCEDCLLKYARLAVEEEMDEMDK